MVVNHKNISESSRLFSACATLALVLAFIMSPQNAEAKRKKATDYLADFGKVMDEIMKDDTDPSRAKNKMRNFIDTIAEAIADKDGDKEPDFAEEIDDKADATVKKIQTERKSEAMSRGFPYNRRGVTLKSSMLGKGTGTTKAARKWAKFVGCPDDDAGHIIGKQLGGKGGVGSKNIFPQNSSYNRGDFAKFEGQVKKTVKKSNSSCPKVTIKASVTFTFGNAHRPHRPTMIHYSVEYGDSEENCRKKTLSRSFPNPMSSMCQKTP